MAKAKFAPDAQAGFEEKVIEDADLEELITERLLSADAASRYATTNRKLKKHIEDKGYEDGIRYRVGEYVFRLESRDRDGYEVGEGQVRRFAELGES